MLCVNPQDHPGANRAGGAPGVGLTSSVVAKRATRSLAVDCNLARVPHHVSSWPTVKGAVDMKLRNKRKPARPKTKLGLPDLEQAKAAVVGSLPSLGSKREYGRSIDEFVAWYCSEPRLSFNKTVVVRFRIHLEERRLAPSTINLRLAAVRRLAYEASDSGLLSPELAAGIRRVKGAKKRGVRLGNWLTQEEARALWQLPNTGTQFYIACCSISGELIESVQDLLDRKHIRKTQIYDKWRRGVRDSAPHNVNDLRNGHSTEA
jgi:hypothetical protein